jgi:hypothetical protein
MLDLWSLRSDPLCVSCAAPRVTGIRLWGDLRCISVPQLPSSHQETPLADPNDEALIRLGNMAENVLRNEDFCTLYGIMVNALASEILLTTPEESKKRSMLYFTHHGLKTLRDRMIEFVSVKEQTEKRIEALLNPHPDDAIENPEWLDLEKEDD